MSLRELAGASARCGEGNCARDQVNRLCMFGKTPFAHRTWLVWVLSFVGCAAALSPFFWTIYRTMIFQTMPRDDYAPFVLWLVGQHGGAFPEAPYGYRLLSAAAALPFYELLPAFHFSNLPTSVTATYMRATAAIAALSYFSALGAAFLCGRIALRCGLDLGHAVLAGALLFVLCWYSQIYGIDPLAILGVTIMVMLIDRPAIFASAIIGSVVLNEKICMVLALWLTIRCLLVPRDRMRLLAPWIASLAALAIYLLMVKLVALPGNAYQIRPAGYPLRIAANIAASLSARGLILNLWPTVLLAGIALIGWRAPDLQGRFRRSDLLLVVALAVLALTVTTDFQIGRIVMHGAPIFVVPAAAAIGALFPKGHAEPGRDPGSSSGRAGMPTDEPSRTASRSPDHPSAWDQRGTPTRYVT